MNESREPSDTVCIVGAGPAGLSMARALRRARIPYRQFERHRDVGGIWDIENPGTPMYHSAHFISSRDMSGFYDYAMPRQYPDYPSHREILRYCRSFAHEFGLYDSIDFSTRVEQVIHDGTSYFVKPARGEWGRYRAVVCATGVTWHPNLPRYPGTFAGEARHSSTFKHPREFRGKRVLIIGLGNSGADIACDAASHADAAFISTRRGYHFIPKHVFGIPVDEFAARGPALPLWMERPLLALLAKAFVGDVTRLGLPRADHKLFETHPLLNTQLLFHLQHGRIRAKGDVERFDGTSVVFKDGTRERIDLVIYATGYEMKIPYVPEEYFVWAGGRPQLQLTAFNPQHDGLFGLGFLETNSSTFTLFDQISHVIANYLADQVTAPDRARAFRELIQRDRPDLSGGIQFIDSNRHKAYVEIGAYRRQLRSLVRRMGWAPLKPGYFDALRDAAGTPRIDASTSRAQAMEHQPAIESPRSGIQKPYSNVVPTDTPPRTLVRP